MQTLEELFQDTVLASSDQVPAVRGALLSGEEPRKPAIAKVRYTHDAMIDLIIAEPAISQNALALHFGYSASWVSNIIASDAFQARLSERTKELVDPTIQASVEKRFEGLVLRSLDILQEKLNRPSDQIPDQLALRALEISARSAGYGAKAQAPITQVAVEVHLENVGDRLTNLLRRKKEESAIDVQVEEIAGG